MDNRALVAIYLSILIVFLAIPSLPVLTLLVSIALCVALQDLASSASPDPRSRCELNGGQDRCGSVHLYFLRAGFIPWSDRFERTSGGWWINSSTRKQASARLSMKAEYVYDREAELYLKILDIVANPYPINDTRRRMKVWSGGDTPPLPVGTEVYVKMRYGTIRRGVVGDGYARNWRHRMEPDDIVAYTTVASFENMIRQE